MVGFPLSILLGLTIVIDRVAFVWIICAAAKR